MVGVFMHGGMRGKRGGGHVVKGVVHDIGDL